MGKKYEVGGGKAAAQLMLPQLAESSLPTSQMATLGLPGQTLRLPGQTLRLPAQGQTKTMGPGPMPAEGPGLTTTLGPGPTSTTTGPGSLGPSRGGAGGQPPAEQRFLAVIRYDE